MKSVDDYENDIISVHNELKDYPGSKTLQKRLSYRKKNGLKCWTF